MIYLEFTRQIRKAGLSIEKFANLLKRRPNSITNYANRRVPDLLAVIAVLMAEMKENEIDFEGKLSRITIKPNKPRGAGENAFGRRE